MAEQLTYSQTLKSIAGAVLVGLGLVILCGRLDGPAVQFTNLLAAAVREAPELLLSIVPAAWQALQAHAFDHREPSPCSVQTLVSFWPLLRVMAGAA